MLSINRTSDYYNNNYKSKINKDRTVSFCAGQNLKLNDFQKVEFFERFFDGKSPIIKNRLEKAVEKMPLLGEEAHIKMKKANSFFRKLLETLQQNPKKVVKEAIADSLNIKQNDPDKDYINFDFEKLFSSLTSDKKYQSFVKTLTNGLYSSANPKKAEEISPLPFSNLGKILDNATIQKQLKEKELANEGNELAEKFLHNLKKDDIIEISDIIKNLRPSDKNSSKLMQDTSEFFEKLSETLKADPEQNLVDALADGFKMPYTIERNNSDLKFKELVIALQNDNDCKNIFQQLKKSIEVLVPKTTLSDESKIYKNNLGDFFSGLQNKPQNFTDQTSTDFGFNGMLADFSKSLNIDSQNPLADFWTGKKVDTSDVFKSTPSSQPKITKRKTPESKAVRTRQLKKEIKIAKAERHKLVTTRVPDIMRSKKELSQEVKSVEMTYAKAEEIRKTNLSKIKTILNQHVRPYLNINYEQEVTLLGDKPAGNSPKLKLWTKQKQTLDIVKNKLKKMPEQLKKLKKLRNEIAELNKDFPSIQLLDKQIELIKKELKNGTINNATYKFNLPKLEAKKQKLSENSRGFEPEISELADKINLLNGRIRHLKLNATQQTTRRERLRKKSG